MFCLHAEPTYLSPLLLSLQAMGENLHDDVAGEAPDARERRLRMIAAVEGDNWSEVIQEQTAEAVSLFVVCVFGERFEGPCGAALVSWIREASRPASSESERVLSHAVKRFPFITQVTPQSSKQQQQSEQAAASPPVTPFARASVHRAVGEGAAQAVDKVRAPQPTCPPAAASYSTGCQQADDSAACRLAPTLPPRPPKPDAG